MYYYKVNIHKHKKVILTNLPENSRVPVIFIKEKCCFVVLCNVNTVLISKINVNTYSGVPKILLWAKTKV